MSTKMEMDEQWFKSQGALEVHFARVRHDEAGNLIGFWLQAKFPDGEDKWKYRATYDPQKGLVDCGYSLEGRTRPQ